MQETTELGRKRNDIKTGKRDKQTNISISISKIEEGYEDFELISVQKDRLIERTLYHLINPSCMA